jgi:hypothetical protein
LNARRQVLRLRSMDNLFSVHLFPPTAAVGYAHLRNPQ